MSLGLLLISSLNQWQDPNEIRWDEFTGQVRQENIDSVTIKENVITGKYRSPVGDKEKFKVNYNQEIHKEWLSENIVNNHDIKSETHDPPNWLY